MRTDKRASYRPTEIVRKENPMIRVEIVADEVSMAVEQRGERRVECCCIPHIDCHGVIPAL